MIPPSFEARIASLRRAFLHRLGRPHSGDLGTTRWGALARYCRDRKGLLGAAVLIGVSLGWHLALAVVIGVPTWNRHRARRLQLTAEERITNALPDGIDMLMLLIQSGCSPVRAFEQLRSLCAPELWPALDLLLLRLHRGQRLSDALAVLITELGPQMIPVVDALRSHDHYGTALGPACDRISDQLLRDRQHRAEVAARTLSVRMSFPLVVCILPAFALAALGPVVINALHTVASLDIS
jgi:tight adherence protein C